MVSRTQEINPLSWKDSVITKSTIQRFQTFSQQPEQA